MEPRKKFFSDERISYLIRLWAAGAVYFFIGWGTGLGSQESVIDFIFFLGLGIGVFNIIVVNPILRRMFNLKSNKRYNDISINKKVMMRLSEIFKSMLIVLIIVYIYSLINVALIKVFSLSPQRVPFPGEPITFGITYVIVLIIVEKIINKFKKHFQ